MDPKKMRVFRVHGLRFEPGDGERPKPQGDISASYSAHTIMDGGKITNPFRFGKNDWVSTGGMSGPGIARNEECYRVVGEKEFKKRWPGVKTFKYPGVCQGEEGDARRKSEAGWYHGMKVGWRGREFVLEGPPVRFEEAV